MADVLAVGLLDHRDASIERACDQPDRHASEQELRDHGMAQAIDGRTVRQSSGLRSLGERQAMRQRIPAPAVRAAAAARRRRVPLRPASAALASPAEIGIGFRVRVLRFLPFSDDGILSSGAAPSSDHRRSAPRSASIARLSRREPRRTAQARVDLIGGGDDVADLFVGQDEVALGVVGLRDRGEANRPSACW